MRANEFICDVAIEMYADLLEDLKLCPDVDCSLFEGQESADMQQFLSSLGATPNVGSTYYVIGAAWVPEIIARNQKSIKFTEYTTPVELIELHPAYSLLQTDTGIKRFPASADKLTELTNCIMLFNNIAQLEQANTIIQLKLSDGWYITRKQV